MDTAAATLQYTSPGTSGGLAPAWRSYWFRIAIVCWIVPLTAGLIVFGWSEVIRPPHSSLHQFYGHGVTNTTAVGRQIVRLIDYGLLDLLLGATLAMYGCISLIVFVLLRWGSAVNRWRQVVRPAFLAAALLLSNFVVAMVLVQIAMR
jgi:hypothetical protein